MKIGILGGTFNPIHIGHLIVSEQIREWFGLDRVYFIPSNMPPHKNGPMLDGSYRLAMVSLALGPNPHFACSAIELERGGVSYTIDTIEEMKKGLGKGDALFFILGADAFKEIDAWKEYPVLLKMCRFIVMSRPGFSLEAVRRNLAPVLEKTGLKLHLKEVKGDDCVSDAVTGGQGISFVSVPLIDISSTRIREYVKRGRSIRYQVPDDVAEYIRENRLYI